MNLYSESKDTFAAKATDEQIRLLLLQRDLEATVGGNFVDTSLSDTIYQLIVQGHAKRVTRLKSDFKVPDKRFWWIKIKALAHIRDWASLEKFAKEKKSPIGYGPFVQVCLDYNAPKEAEKYIARIQEPAEKAEYYIKIGAWMEAGEVARVAKDLNLLQNIRSKCTVREMQGRLDQMIQQFSVK